MKYHLLLHLFCFRDQTAPFCPPLPWSRQCSCKEISLEFSPSFWLTLSCWCTTAHYCSLVFSWNWFQRTVTAHLCWFISAVATPSVLISPGILPVLLQNTGMQPVLPESLQYCALLIQIGQLSALMQQQIYPSLCCKNLNNKERLGIRLHFLYIGEKHILSCHTC